MIKSKVNDFDDYYFFPIIDPIISCNKITPAEKLLWGIIYTWEKMDGKFKINLKIIANKISITKRHVIRCIENLLKLNLLEIVNNDAKFKYRVNIPKWLKNDFNNLIEGQNVAFNKINYNCIQGQYVTPKVTICHPKGDNMSPLSIYKDLKKERKSAFNSECANSKPKIKKLKNRLLGKKGNILVQKKSENNLPQKNISIGEKSDISGNNEIIDSRQKNHVELVKLPKHVKKSCDEPNFGQNEHVIELDFGEDFVEEEFEPNFENDGPSKIEFSKVKKVEKNKKNGKRKISGEEFTNIPSKRWEFNKWREKEINKWNGIDCVGYWICRFENTQKEEDPSFFYTKAKHQKIMIMCKNARDYIRIHFRNDISKFKESVELILKNARDKNKPVSFSYFYTPSNFSTLFNFRKMIEKNNGKNNKSLQEINNENGSNSDLWDKIFEDEQTSL